MKIAIYFREKRFTHAILNPPYKKINSMSRHRLLLRQVGIETVNLYSAFVALTIELMQPGGHIVAIIPRSFCNGPYYRPFREIILSNTAIKHMHLFGARDRAFKDDGVLQENIIIVLERGVPQGSVAVSTSTDDSLTDSFFGAVN
jgi:adenine-specific DNA-methyltransferase